MEKMRISRTGTCNDRGFTLLELIVVLFVLSVIMAIVLPSLAGFGEGRLKSEAKEIASVLRYVNDSAASRKETFSMKFDLDKNLVSWKGPEGEKVKRFDDLTAVTAQSMGTVSKGEAIFFFGPFGINENLSVHVGRGNKNATITLNHLSGRVKIESKDEG
jgi:general secretion pathway protein H